MKFECEAYKNLSVIGNTKLSFVNGKLDTNDEIAIDKLIDLPFVKVIEEKAQEVKQDIKKKVKEIKEEIINEDEPKLEDIM